MDGVADCDAIISINITESMTPERDNQEGSKNYQRFLKFFNIINRYRKTGLYQWIHNNQRLAIILIILLGAAIFLFLFGFILTGIDMVK